MVNVIVNYCIINYVLAFSVQKSLIEFGSTTYSIKQNEIFTHIYTE